VLHVSGPTWKRTLKETLKKVMLPSFVFFMAFGYVIVFLTKTAGTCILYFLTLFNFSYIYHGVIDSVWIHHYSNYIGTLRPINDFFNYVSILFLSLTM